MMGLPKRDRRARLAMPNPPVTGSDRLWEKSTNERSGIWRRAGTGAAMSAANPSSEGESSPRCDLAAPPNEMSHPFLLVPHKRAPPRVGRV